MIAAVREWLTSVVVVTLLVSVAQTLILEETLRKIASFVGGLILLVVLLQPLLKTDLENFPLNFEDYKAAIEEQQRVFESVGQDALRDEVAEKTADSIEEKAAALGMRVKAQIRTTVEENGTPIPSAVEVAGKYNAALAAWIETVLGIPEERQTWKMSGDKTTP